MIAYLQSHNSMAFLNESDNNLAFITASDRSGFLHLYYYKISLDKENFTQLSYGSFFTFESWLFVQCLNVSFAFQRCS